MRPVAREALPRDRDTPRADFLWNSPWSLEGDSDSCCYSADGEKHLTFLGIPSVLLVFPVGHVTLEAPAPREGPGWEWPGWVGGARVGGRGQYYCSGCRGQVASRLTSGPDK